jgi:hypothetical protein
MSRSADFLDAEGSISNIICEASPALLAFVAASPAQGVARIKKDKTIEQKGKGKGKGKVPPLGMNREWDDVLMLMLIRDWVQGKLDGSRKAVVEVAAEVEVCNAEKPAEEPVADPAENFPRGPTEETVDNPTEEVIQDSADEAIEHYAKDVIPDSADETAEDSAEETAEETAEEPAADPAVRETAQEVHAEEEPAEEEPTEEGPAERLIKEESAESTPAEESAEEPTKKEDGAQIKQREESTSASDSFIETPRDVDIEPPEAVEPQRMRNAKAKRELDVYTDDSDEELVQSLLGKRSKTSP